MKTTKTLAILMLISTLIVPVVIDILDPIPADASQIRRRLRRRRKHARTGRDSTRIFGQFDILNFVPEDSSNTDEFKGNFIDDAFNKNAGIGLFPSTVQDFSLQSNIDFRFSSPNLHVRETENNPEEIDILFSQGNLLAETIDNSVRYTIFHCFNDDVDCLINQSNSQHPINFEALSSEPVNSSIEIVGTGNNEFYYVDRSESDDNFTAFVVLETLEGIFTPALTLQEEKINAMGINAHRAVNDLDYIIDRDLLNGLIVVEEDSDDGFSNGGFQFRSSGAREIEASSRTAIPEASTYLGTLVAASFILGFRQASLKKSTKRK